MFIDQVTITVRSGKGGNGCLSFRREKCLPKGGPDGGDGGDGGSIYLQSSFNYNTLGHIRNLQKFRAGNGQPGRGRKQKGANGKDVIIPVPPGTLAYNADTAEVLADFDSELMEVAVLRGGKGGLGNIHFKTSTNQAPRRTIPGEEGDEIQITLELKLLADVAIVGFPNAGKSSLLRKISKARPKIASYPFTTLNPHLGVVDINGIRYFTAADIPGLIEGAHEGTGLGDRFLRHIERTKLLLHIIDISEKDATDLEEAYDIIRNELISYDELIGTRPEVLALNKIDLVESDEKISNLKRHFKKKGLSPFFISARNGTGIEELVQHVGEKLLSMNVALYGDILEGV